MTDRIVELLPSAALRSRIREINHRFNDTELLQIIYNFAPTYEERIALMEKFADTFTSDASLLARAYIKYEKEKLNRFSDSEGCIYELIVEESPDAPEERYVCATFNDAMLCIDKYHDEYEEFINESSSTQYRILKRKIFSSREKFREDSVGECILAPGKTLLSVWIDDPFDCETNNLCSACERICPHRCDEVLYPSFAKKYDIIKHYDYRGRIYFGVHLGTCEDGDLLEDLYVIDLQSKRIRMRDFENYWFAHEHVSLPRSEVITPEELDEQTRLIYLEFIDFLNKEETNEGLRT